MMTDSIFLAAYQAAWGAYSAHSGAGLVDNYTHVEEYYKEYYKRGRRD